MNKRILNLGAGTQSSVLLLMMERGELPRADYAIFADTGWEPKAVYEQVEWLKQQTSIPIVTVSKGNIFEDAMTSQVRGTKEKGKRWASMPLYVMNDKKLVTFAGDSLWGPDSDEYLIDLDDPEQGQIKRQCTSEYKLWAIRKWIHDVLFGLNPGQRWPTEPQVNQVFGISFDERSRMKIADKWATFEYPLVDLKWQRERAIQWARENYPDRKFPRSACIGCPFHSHDEWVDIAINDPDGFATAVALDERLRHAFRLRGEVFLHRDCMPLREIKLQKRNAGQGTFDPKGLVNDCSGMCGV